jgi:tetratricopeptide (TPR) repeat protein
MRKSLLFLFLFVFITNLQAQNGGIEDYTQQYQVKKSDLANLCAKEYFTLARWCKECGLSRERGDCLKDVLKYAPSDEEAETELKEEVLKTVKPATNAEKLLNTYDQKLLGLKKKLSDEYVKLGMWCKQAKLVSEAKEVFKTAIEIYENNSTARKELDQAKVSGFGWVDNGTAKKLNQGLREYKGDWLPKEKVNELRSNWSDAWKIKTRHYLIKTNNTYEQGYELSQQLEELYTMFFRVFGNALEIPEPKVLMHVNYLKSQSEFSAEYQKANGYLPASPLGMTGNMIPGIPWSATAWFWGPQKNPQGTEKDTMLHECTHLLFNPPQPFLTEGVANYFMSLYRTRDGNLTVGDKSHSNYALNFAKLGTSVPLKQFLTTPRERFNTGENYGQAAAFIRFFLSSPDGQKYKSQFINFAKLLNSNPRIDVLSAFDECFPGIDITKLEKEFHVGYLK